MLLVAVAIITVVSLSLIARFTRDAPVVYADPEEHFKYGSLGGERESGNSLLDLEGPAQSISGISAGKEI